VSQELERARKIVSEVAPTHWPDLSCMLVGAAIAGMRGLTMGRIRIGALFWPDKFRDDPYLSMRGGWGCEAYSPADQKLYLASQEIDDDGGFAGHTWIEPEPHDVLDLMHDVENGMREIYGEDFKIVGKYIPRPKLERAVKRYWRPQMLAAIKLGKLTAVTK
jgi:hypothetical protein